MIRENEIIDVARERAERHQIAEMELHKGNKQLYFYDRIYNSEIASFEAGAKWADNNPNLSLLWHDASEEPKIWSNIVIINKTGRLWNIRMHDDDYDWPDIKDWICCVRTYDIQKWAYIEDILPK